MGLFSDKSYDANIILTTYNLLNELNIKVTKTTIKDDIEKHPDFPSLNCISEVLKSFNVDNITLNFKNEDLKKIPTPFVTYSKFKGGVFYLVKKIDSHVTYLNQENEIKVLAIEPFLNETEKIAMIVSHSNQINEDNYNIKRKKEILNFIKIPFIILLNIVFILFYSANNQSTHHIILLSLHFLGTITSCLLLSYSLKFESTLLKMFCNTKSKRNSCFSILNSKHSSLFNFISWSEIGFIYFSGNFLYLLFDNNPASNLYHIIISTVVLPYTVFSILYQWKIAKEWCKLCLTVQFILISEFLINLIYLKGNINFTISTTLVYSFFIPITILIFFKDILNNYQNAKQIRLKYVRLKQNRSVFSAILYGQKNYLIQENLPSIDIGNLDSKNEIIIVSNPYCDPCSETHNEVSNLLANKCRIRIIFTCDTDINNDLTKPAKHIIAVFLKTKDKAKVETALNKWFRQKTKSYKEYLKVINIPVETKESNSYLESMKSWCLKNKITQTPTIIFNGKQLPDIYSISDLAKLIT